VEKEKAMIRKGTEEPYEGEEKEGEE